MVANRKQIERILVKEEKQRRAIKNVTGQYADQLWRISNLYWIIDKAGKRVKFKPNESQLYLYENMWHRNVILKARQRGYTTFIGIFALDSCIFIPNFSAGIIAHNLEDSKKIFRTKVKYPFENLPDGVRNNITASNDRSGEYVFSNDSSISVSTSYRSGTLQLLHVSEYGKISCKYPDKAKEIKTGAFEAVPRDGTILIESTAEGQGGEFYEITKKAQALQQEGAELTPMDMKFFFDAWWQNPDYTMSQYKLIDEEHSKYFKRLEDDHGIELTQEQKWWYVAKHDTQQDEMKKEYPSYPDEAFEAAVEGVIYSRQMAKVRLEGRIRDIPIESGVPVHTFWDLGKGDKTAIWFMQEVGHEVRWIDFYQDSMEDIEHYCKVIKDKGYLYGSHYMPHDVNVELLGMKKNRKAQFEEGGVKPIIPVDRIPTLIEGVQMVRQDFSKYYFDKTRCSQGITNLDNYKWKWNDQTGEWSHNHVHNWASDGCDALRQKAQAYKSARMKSKYDDWNVPIN